ncbi:MAG: thermonuclease family protein [Nannocystaceae bacterium]|nr:thermonuclease family protein [bacterium]
MSNRNWKLASAVAAIAVAAFVTPAVDAKEPQTKVYINGKPTPVFFNDGDSFRVLGGSYQGTKARLAGYNTLESYGPVHSWGDWTEKEMYVIAKMATYHARKGVWHCETDGDTDTYGRMLLWCEDLATELVREGYAHAMSINDDPAKPVLVEAQREAIANRRGLWAHGVPKFILTSLHSAEEDVDGRGTYNRLVSSDDAHSVKWKHTNRYSECDKICHSVFEVDDAAVDAVTAELKTDAKVAPWIAGVSDADLRGMVEEFAEFHHINRAIDKEVREDFKQHLLVDYVQQGKFGEQRRSDGACMRHVDFKRRFGEGRASCLK